MCDRIYHTPPPESLPTSRPSDCYCGGDVTPNHLFRSNTACGRFLILLSPWRSNTAVERTRSSRMVHIGASHANMRLVKHQSNPGNILMGCRRRHHGCSIRATKHSIRRVLVSLHVAGRKGTYPEDHVKVRARTGPRSNARTYPPSRTLLKVSLLDAAFLPALDSWSTRRTFSSQPLLRRQRASSTPTADKD